MEGHPRKQVRLYPCCVTHRISLWTSHAELCIVPLSCVLLLALTIKEGGRRIRRVKAHVWAKLARLLCRNSEGYMCSTADLR